MADNITELPNVERDKLIATTENLKRNLQALIEQCDYVAKLRHAQFAAYTKAGFTEAQALQLVKAWP